MALLIGEEDVSRLLDMWKDYVDGFKFAGPGLISNQGKSRNSIDEHLKHCLGSFLVRYNS
jgi:hypothetical protein